MRYRPANLSDEPSINRIHNQHDFDLPISSSEVAGVAVDDDETIVGFIMVRRIFETILILDLERSKKDRIEALKECFKGALFESRLAGIDQIHAFVQDVKFAELLKKYFGFRDCVGQAIITDIGDKYGQE